MNVVLFLIAVLLGMCLGISASYAKIIKDKKFSWKSKFYIIKEVDIKE